MFTIHTKSGIMLLSYDNKGENNMRTKYETVRVNYNLPIKLVERVRQFSEKFGVPATQGVIILLNSGLRVENSQEQLLLANELANKVQELKNEDLDLIS